MKAWKMNIDNQLEHKWFISVNFIMDLYHTNRLLLCVVCRTYLYSDLKFRFLSLRYS